MGSGFLESYAGTEDDNVFGRWPETESRKHAPQTHIKDCTFPDSIYNLFGIFCNPGLGFQYWEPVTHVTR